MFLEVLVLRFGITRDHLALQVIIVQHQGPLVNVHARAMSLVHIAISNSGTISTSAISFSKGP